MNDRELIQALRCCVSSPHRDGCRNTCVFYNGDINCCIPEMGKAVADRLEALLAENERLKSQLPKWVSVEERLPELNVMVVGITKDNPFSRYVPQVVHRNEHGWVFTYSMRYVTDVTHWMPLPSTEGVE